MTWAELKVFFSNMAPQAISGIIQATSGSPTELALYIRMGNNRLASIPHKFSWLLRDYTLTLTGASEYNLRTLIPDLVRVRYVTGSALPNNVATYVSGGDFYRRVFGSGVMTIQNNILKFDTPPTSGTLTIPYYSNYLVVDDSGVRKLDFVDDTDASIIPIEHQQLLIEATHEWIQRKEKKKPYTIQMQLLDGRIVEATPFMALLNEAIATDRPIAEGIFDFRFNG